MLSIKEIFSLLVWLSPAKESIKKLLFYYYLIESLPDFFRPEMCLPFTIQS